MIPYGKQFIDEDDIAAVTEVLRSDFLTTGPKVAEFEEKLCEVTGAQHAVACSNGTAALHLACIAAGIEKGDTVIVPSVTFLASANAARYCDADVIFSDVNPRTGLMEASHLEEALSRSNGADIKAVIPVHLTGQCADLKAIQSLCAPKGIKIIADACHAIGGELHDRPVGVCEIEDFSAFSFHPVKTIATGEGGAITTNDKEAAERMKRSRHHGMNTVPENGPWYYEMHDLGYNYRLTDIQCVLGISQLNKLEKFVSRRKEITQQYNELLRDMSAAITLPASVPYADPALHIYAIQVDFETLGISRPGLMNALKEEGILTQVHYIPVHKQPYYKNLYGKLSLKGAEQYYDKTLTLPLYPSMSDDDVVYVVNKLKQIIGG